MCFYFFYINTRTSRTILSWVALHHRHFGSCGSKLTLLSYPWPMIEVSELRVWVDGATGKKTLWHVKTHSNKWETWSLGTLFSMCFYLMVWFTCGHIYCLCHSCQWITCSFSQEACIGALQGERQTWPGAFILHSPGTYELLACRSWPTYRWRVHFLDVHLPHV